MATKKTKSTTTKKAAKKMGGKPTRKASPGPTRRRAPNWGSLYAAVSALKLSRTSDTHHATPGANVQALLATLRLVCGSSLQRLFPRGRTAGDDTRAVSEFIGAVRVMAQTIAFEAERMGTV